MTAQAQVPTSAGDRRAFAAELMTLKILLPYQVFAHKSGVSRIVAETREGSFGLLPHRLDCVAPLGRAY